MIQTDPLTAHLKAFEGLPVASPFQALTMQGLNIASQQPGPLYSNVVKLPALYRDAILLARLSHILTGGSPYTVSPSQDYLLMPDMRYALNAMPPSPEVEAILASLEQFVNEINDEERAELLYPLELKQAAQAHPELPWVTELWERCHAREQASALLRAKYEHGSHDDTQGQEDIEYARWQTIASAWRKQVNDWLSVRAQFENINEGRITLSGWSSTPPTTLQEWWAPLDL